MAATSACTCTVAPPMIRVPVCTPLSMPGRPRPDWAGAQRGAPRPGPPGGGVESGAAFPSRHARRRRPPAGALRLAQAGDRPADGVVQGARWPRRRVGHTRAGSRPRRRGVVRRQPRARTRLCGVEAGRSRHRRRPQGCLGGQGVRAPAVRRAPRAPRRRLPRGGDACPRARRPRREPLRVAVQRSRRHRGPVDGGPRAGRPGARPGHRGRSLRRWGAAGGRDPRPGGDRCTRRRGRVRSLALHERRAGGRRDRADRGRADRGRRAGGQSRAGRGDRRHRARPTVSRS